MDFEGRIQVRIFYDYSKNNFVDIYFNSVSPDGEGDYEGLTIYGSTKKIKYIYVKVDNFHFDKDLKKYTAFLFWDNRSPEEWASLKKYC